MVCTFTRIFVPQSVLDEWSVGEHILIDGNDMILSPSGWRYRLTPAIHIQKCVSGSDPRGLVGKARPEEALKGEGAEVYLGSVVLGEAAYEGVPGFLAHRLDAVKGKTDGKDVEVLTKFLLDNI